MISKLKNAFGGARFGALPSLPPALRNNLTPLLVLAVIITAAVMMFMWQDQANYKPVFGAREKVAASDMMTSAAEMPSQEVPDMSPRARRAIDSWSVMGGKGRGNAHTTNVNGQAVYRSFCFHHLTEQLVPNSLLEGQR